MSITVLPSFDVNNGAGRVQSGLPLRAPGDLPGHSAAGAGDEQLSLANHWNFSVSVPNL